LYLEADTPQMNPWNAIIPAGSEEAMAGRRKSRIRHIWNK